MPYDDDDRMGFRDWRDLEALLRSFFSTPDNLTLGRLKGVLRELAELLNDRDIKQLGVYEIHATLQRYKLGSLTVDAAIELLGAIEPYLEGAASAEDAIGQLTLRDLEAILARVHDSR